ncbi:DMT family transporter [Streptomyces sp. NBC_00820]|uniref:DMT family transporter n=1 Tax=Streptomyces sp. NBC_00820 TaxID=2975842 RepID=UPI002ED2FBAA|nr:DMT family transporter [Streptomyces sp. NBC_00820]
MNIVLYAVIVLFWGTTWIGIKLQLGSVDPAVSVAYRFLLAAVCMFVWTGVRKLPMRFPLRSHLRLALVGLLMYSSNYVLFYYCSEHLVSGLVSIIFCLSVGFNILNGRLFLKRPVSRTVVLGSLAGVLGLALVFGNDITHTKASSELLTGVLLGLGATLLFSLGNITSSWNQSAGGLPIVQSTAWSMLYGGVFTSLGCLAAGNSFTVEPSFRYLAGLVYLSVCGSAIAFVTYLTLLSRIGPDRAAFATVAFPIVSLSLSTVFEDYRWSALAVLGVLVVLAANAAILAGPRLRRLLGGTAPGGTAETTAEPRPVPESGPRRG